MKILEIRNCRACPYRENEIWDAGDNGKRLFFCTHPETSGIEIPNIQDIPEFCKLQDYV